MTKSAPPSNLESARAILRSVCSPPLRDLDCPFCGETEVSMLMGKANFFATWGDKELCDEKVSLTALICAKSHLFFVLEHDMAATVATAAA